MLYLTLLAAFMMGAVHIFAWRLTFLGRIPRSWWLSFAGGVSMAYVFVHILPVINSTARTVTESGEKGVFHWLEQRTDLVALLGLTVYYSLERIVRGSCKRESAPDKSSPPFGVYALHISAFAVYIAAVGYLLHLEPFEPKGLALFTIALMLHFVVIDFGLRELHESTYERSGRWILAVAPVVGWVLGWFAVVPEKLLSVLVAFLAGGIILNALKEELPAERESQIVPFISGVIFYTALLLSVE